MTKPLVVFTGQGLSIADKFNLTCELQRREPKLFKDFSKDERDNLDLVIGKYRDSDLSKHHILHERIKQLTERDEFIKRGFSTTIQLCKMLNKISRVRPVVLFTTNVDRACRFASLENDAEWFFGREILGSTSLPNIQKWIKSIKSCQNGFYYFPLHGEPDFLSTGNGGLDFTTIPNTSWNSTTAEGVGSHAAKVDTTFNIPKYGYGLIEDLLLGAYSIDKIADGSDFLVIGYGAGSTHQRCEYPFERRIKSVFNKPAANLGDWHIVARFGEKNNAANNSLAWFKQYHFTTHSVGTIEPTCEALFNDILAQMIT